jgi:hypothetical protein
MSKNVKLIPKRGLEENIESTIVEPGELLLTSDTRNFFVGDENGVPRSTNLVSDVLDTDHYLRTKDNWVKSLAVVAISLTDYDLIPDPKPSNILYIITQ